MEGVGASEGNGVIFTENAVTVSVSISLGALQPCFPAGLFIWDVALAASSPIASDRVADRNVPADLAQVQESGGTSREARGGGGLALKRSTMIDAIANRNAATRVTAIRDHIPISSRALLGAVDYAPLARGDVSVRPDLLCGNEVISQCKTTAMQKRLLSPPADERHGAMWDMALGGRR